MSYFANVFRGMLEGLEDLLTHGEWIGEWEKRERKGYTLIEVLSSEPRYEKTLWVLLPALSREEKVGQKNKTEKKILKKENGCEREGKRKKKKKTFWSQSISKHRTYSLERREAKFSLDCVPDIQHIRLVRCSVSNSLFFLSLSSTRIYFHLRVVEKLYPASPKRLPAISVRASGRTGRILVYGRRWWGCEGGLGVPLKLRIPTHW